jgi:hypothetical protein
MIKQKIAGLLAGVVLVLVGGCDFILGPDEPAGSGAQGNLTINMGTGADRAISSPAGLPGDVLDAIQYELTMTGPEGETLTRTLSTGETLSLTVAVGGWRIDARAYQQPEVLAGTGSVSFTVEPGSNSARIPVNMSGDCYVITVDPALTHGTVVPNFTAAFPGTAVTLSVTSDSGYALSPGTLTYNNGTSDLRINDDTFVMPAADTTVKARFIQGDIDLGFDW